MLCRSTSTTPSLSCWNGNTGGQQLSYDALRRLISWQNAPGSLPTTSGQYAYDGEGTRVWQQTQAVNGSTTTTTDTVYALGTDELTTTSVTGQQPATTNIRSYPLPGGALAERDATGLYYLATDQLGTPIATLRLNTGTLVGTQLRTPYGQARYAATSTTNGGMHTSFGFTGQREDIQAPGSSGLTYFNSRYYDPLIGRFTSADSVVGSDPLLDGYAYVGGMVESATDPSGHLCYCDGPPNYWWDSQSAAILRNLAAIRLEYQITKDEQAFAQTTLMGTVTAIDPQGNFEVTSYFGTDQKFTMDFSADYQEIGLTLPNGQHFNAQDLENGATAAHGGQLQEKAAATQWLAAHQPKQPPTTTQKPTGPTGPQGSGNQGPGNNDNGNGNNGNSDNTWDNGVVTYVIGETMTRVRRYARRHGYHWYQPWRKSKSDPMERNMNWLEGLMDNGVRIVDIGYDNGPPGDPERTPRLLRSTFYQAERDLIQSYWNYFWDTDSGV